MGKLGGFLSVPEANPSRRTRAPVRGLTVVAIAALAAAAWGAEEPAVRALQQHQLQRQQQQDALQLRMRQQQSGAQNLPAEAQQQVTDLLQIEQRQRQLGATDRLRIEQRQRQQQLHDRQGIEPSTAQPSEDEAGRRTKSQMELQKAREAGQQQLRRFESELQPKPAAGTDPLRTVN